MSYRFLIGNLKDGRRLRTLPTALSASWEDTLNGVGRVELTVATNTQEYLDLAIADVATPGKSFLAVAYGDTILQAGPIWVHDYDDDAQTLRINAGGLWSYFDHRVLIPVLASGVNPVDAAADTNLVSSLQGIAVYLVQQAQSHTNGSVPVVLPAQISGENVRNYLGSDLGIVGERLSQLTEVEGGPDIAFRPRFTEDRLGVEWVMQVGTPDQPLIASPIRHKFNVGLPESTVTGLKVKVDGTRLASRAYATGGRTDDKALISTQADPFLTGLGWPLLETTDGSHSTVSVRSTLDGYAREALIVGREPLKTFTFNHRLEDTARLTKPGLSDFQVGDFADLTVRDNHYLGNGRFGLRIVARSGTEDPTTISIQTQPEVL